MTSGPLPPGGADDFFGGPIFPNCSPWRGGDPWTCCFRGKCATITGHVRGSVTEPGSVLSTFPASKPPATPTPATTPIALPSSTQEDLSSSTHISEPIVPSLDTAHATSGSAPTSIGPVKSIQKLTSSSYNTTITKHDSDTVTVYSQDKTTRIVSVTNVAPSRPTTLPPTLSPSSTNSSHGIRPGIIAAIVPVVVVALVFCVGGAWICRRRRVRRAETSSWRTSALLGTSSRRSNYHTSLDRRNR